MRFWTENWKKKYSEVDECACVRMWVSTHKQINGKRRNNFAGHKSIQ